MLTVSFDSTLSRSDQTLHAPPPGGGLARDEGALQPEIDVDRGRLSCLNKMLATASSGLTCVTRNLVDTAHFLGDEPDATLRYRLVGYIRSSLLAANDACQ